MDNLLKALLEFKNDKFDDCIINCDNILQKNEYDQAAWSLKMQALTLKVYVDDIEFDQSGIVETNLDDCTLSNITKPGTSLKTTDTSTDNLNKAMRPISQSGFLRSNNESLKGSNLDQAIATPRTAHTSRPISAASGRYVRLGTTSMLSNEFGEFIILSRLNFHKYSKRNTLSKQLFEFILYHENNIKHSLELAALATEFNNFQDWWWKMQLGKCYFRLGLYRDAEQQFRSVLHHQPIIEAYLWLGKIFQKLDQPLSSLEIYQTGLNHFPLDVSLLISEARIYEKLNQTEKYKDIYKVILEQDNMNVEVIACIANNYFYEDQAEIALKFYRRLFQMGIQTVELMNNLALCCFYSQQFDMCITCFTKALTLATEENIADVYYNIGIIAMSIGDNGLAYQNFRLALSYNNDHAESYNNLGVLEMQKGFVDMARAFFQAAGTTNSRLFESHLNFGLLAERTGDLQASYMSIKKALSLFPNHSEAKDMMKSLSELFSSV